MGNPSFDLNSINWQSYFRNLSNQIQDIALWIKDTAGRFVMANEKFYTMCRQPSEQDLIGLTDHDLFPQHHADGYVADDKKVMETGECIRGRTELILNPDGTTNWYCTTKFPLKNEEGAIIGTVGFTRDLKIVYDNVNPIMNMVPVINFIKENFSRHLLIEELAAQVRTPPEQFRAKFKRLFQLEPEEYVHKVRVETAGIFLSGSADSIVQIALNCGFSGEEEFRDVFGSFKGMTPEAYREKYSI